MLDFNLDISRNGSDFYSVDLFPDQRLEYSLDFYDSLELDKIKMPFYTSLKLPLTLNNKTSNRFSFDPAVNSAASFPRDDFHFRLKIFNGTGSATTIAGILNVTSFEYNSKEPYIEVELKDQIAYYLTKIKEVNISELYNDASHTTAYSLSNFFNNLQGFSGGQKGQIGVAPSSSADIIFPYVDMNNDLEKYGYPQRQFLEYGTGIKRCGIIPAFSVQKFLEYVGDYLTTAGFPVRVDSKLFAVGDFAGSPYDANFEPENLRFITSAHILADKNTNQRTFTLQQGKAWVGDNVSLEFIGGLDGNDKLFRTEYWGNMEIHGNSNAGAITAWSQQNWGARKRVQSTYPESTNDSLRGWFCPKVSYNAELRLAGNPTSVTVSGMQVELPVVDEDKLVASVNHSSSTIKFTPYIGLFEDGLQIKEIALTNSNGDPLELSPNNRTSAYSNKNNPAGDYDYIDSNDNQVLVYNSISGAVYDTLTFADFTAYFPSGEEVFINGGSKYSVNYYMRPVSGYVDLDYVSTYTGTNPRYANSFTNANVDFDRFGKIITRLGSFTEAAKLNLVMLAKEDSLPHNATDLITIKDSISQTTSDTIYDVLLRISKRFNCGFFYEYDAVNAQNVLRIDPLHIMRGSAYNADALIDDLKSVRMSTGGSRIKSLTIENKDYDRYFDEQRGKELTMGSTTQVINQEGVRDLEVKLDSSVFYKSLCGDESFDRPQNLESGAFSENQLGLAKNIYSQNDEIGFRFAYVKAPSYATWILHPFITYTTDVTTGSMKTETERLYLRGTIGKGELANTQFVFNGELTHVNGSGFDLRAEDESGNTTDYYDLYSGSEGLLLANNALIEFDMVVPTSLLGNLDFLNQSFTAPSITSNSIYVKSAEGDVYGDYAYLTVTGLVI